VSNVITRGGGFEAWQKGAVPDGLVLAILLDRSGGWAVPCWLRGFALALDALATTYNTTTHLLLIGRDLPAMRRAAQAVIGMDGGIATADGWQFPLTIAGMMSPEPFAATVRAQADLEQRLRSAGFPFGDILYALLFLTCDFLPGWRLTPRGVIDVKSGDIVEPPMLTAVSH